MASPTVLLGVTFSFLFVHESDVLTADGSLRSDETSSGHAPQYRAYMLNIIRHLLTFSSPFKCQNLSFAADYYYFFRIYQFLFILMLIIEAFFWIS
jgi:hypothetical protein